MSIHAFLSTVNPGGGEPVVFPKGTQVGQAGGHFGHITGYSDIYSHAMGNLELPVSIQCISLD